jgi:hypothetical protein
MVLGGKQEGLDAMHYIMDLVRDFLDVLKDHFELISLPKPQ